MRNYLNCTLCPRQCGVNRTKRQGFCGQSDKIRIARAGLHMWEEPCISGERGSGTVFFSGCTLKCCFCQNYEISHLNKGYYVTAEQLCRIFLDLQDQGAHNINLVSPTPFLPSVLEALELAKPKLHIPIVMNCGGYERVETIRALKGYIDIYLPDFKYFSSEASKKYSSAADYYDVAIEAITEMQLQVGKPLFGNNGMMQRGVIVRHLVMPGLRHDSEAVITALGERFAKDDILLSVMSQYTPLWLAKEYPEINRRTATFEVRTALKAAERFGFEGFSQERESATTAYIPPFEGSFSDK